MSSFTTASRNILLEYQIKEKLPEHETPTEQTRSSYKNVTAKPERKTGAHNRIILKCTFNRVGMVLTVFIWLRWM
jgi:hypothetical protein